MAAPKLKNIDLFKKYKIPFREVEENQIIVNTANISYMIDLTPIKNNPYVFKVTDMTHEKVTVESKDKILNRLCKHFNLAYKHWDDKVDFNHQLFEKSMPKEIKVGNEYTTSWAMPLSKWKLKEILDEDDKVILVSPKSKKYTLSKISDLRIWTIKK